MRENRVFAIGITVTGLILAFTMNGCGAGATYTESYRPQFHFTPEKGWMNDPNGLVTYDGEYHLFYQYLPETIDHHGAKHWGHAVSPDLVHWEHLPIALYPDQLGAIWSGSAVVDWNNSSGLQTGDEKVLMAIFTQEHKGHQQQGIAYSNDRGRNWIMYPDNPVIPNPGIQDFRDPKVFWHDESNRWVMVIATSDRVMIYTSPDLRRWTYASEFGELEGAHGGVWECPDLFELPVDHNVENKRWVMLVSIGDGSPNGGSGTQYFVGDFDGTRFINSNPHTTTLWLDYGRDNYAGITFSDVPEQDGRRIFLGWMSNWRYAEDIPTSPWRGTMTIPRELVLKTTQSKKVRLASIPVIELLALRGKSLKVEDRAISETMGLTIADCLTNGAFEVLVEYEPGTASEFGLVVGNTNGEKTTVGYEALTQRLFVDRRDSGVTDFNPDFAGFRHEVMGIPESNRMRLDIFVDRSSIEVLANDGSVSITDLVFPRSPYNRLELYAKGGDGHLWQTDVWEMESIWRE